MEFFAQQEAPEVKTGFYNYFQVKVFIAHPGMLVFLQPLSTIPLPSPYHHPVQAVGDSKSQVWSVLRRMDLLIPQARKENSHFYCLN